MPRYAFSCRECATEFEVTRPMSRSSDPATCPAGHEDTVKLLTTVALTGSGSGGFQAAPAGGCCGGACGCGH